MKFWKPISLTAALVFSSSANAALITETFTSTVSSGAFAGAIATGSFTYENSLIIGDGFIDLNQGLSSVSLTVFGQTFTEANDIAYSRGLPGLEFENGALTLLDFYISETSMLVDGSLDNDVTNINLEGVNDFGSFTLNQTASNTYNGSFIVNELSTVPVPAAVWLFGSGLIGLVGIARRKKA